MKRYLFNILILIFVISCSKNENEVKTDFKDLPKTIQQQISDAQTKCPLCGVSIFAFRYNGKMIFGSVCGSISTSQNLWCDCIMVYYDETGEPIAYNENKYKDINAKKELIKKLYSCAD